MKFTRPLYKELFKVRREGGREGGKAFMSLASFSFVPLFVFNLLTYFYLGLCTHKKTERDGQRLGPRDLQEKRHVRPPHKSLADHPSFPPSLPPLSPHTQSKMAGALALERFKKNAMF